MIVGTTNAYRKASDAEGESLSGRQMGANCTANLVCNDFGSAMNLILLVGFRYKGLYAKPDSLFFATKAWTGEHVAHVHQRYIWARSDHLSGCNCPPVGTKILCGPARRRMRIIAGLERYEKEGC